MRTEDDTILSTLKVLNLVCNLEFLILWESKYDGFWVLTQKSANGLTLAFDRSLAAIARAWSIACF